MTIDTAFTHFPTLTTDRLHLRQIQPTDAEALFVIRSNQEVLEFYGQEPHQSIEDAHKLIQRLQTLYAGWVECKMEEDLGRLAKKMPFRYKPGPDGSWFCPPGEAYAAQFGLTYQLFSSREIDWTYIQNLRFLGDYLRGSPPPVSPDVALAIRTVVMSHPGIRLLDLIATLHRGKADDVYQLILTDHLYVNLRAVRLTDYEHVQVFLDHDQAESYATLQPTATSLPRPSTLQLTVGAPIVLDGKAWTIFNINVTGPRPREALYAPLLWMFREISTCTRHGVRLHTHCPHCARSLPHLTWRSQPGYCAFCSGALFKGQEDGVQTVAVDSHEFAWQQWVTHALGAVLAQLPVMSVEPKRERIRQVVSYAVEQPADGNTAASKGTRTSARSVSRGRDR